MEQTLWADFLIKQAPIIIVLSILCYGMYKYLTKVIEAKEIIIQKKDERMEELLQEHMNLQKQNIETYGKLANILQQVYNEIIILKNAK